MGPVGQGDAGARVFPHPLWRGLDVEDDLSGGVGEEGGLEEGYNDLVHKCEVPHSLHQQFGT